MFPLEVLIGIALMRSCTLLSALVLCFLSGCIGFEATSEIPLDPSLELDATSSSNSNPGAQGSLFVGQPSVRPNPIERAPLIAIIDFEAAEAVEAVVEVSDGDRSWEQPWNVSPTNRHSIAVIGMRPDRAHTFRVKIRVPGTDQESTSEPLSFRTPALPSSFPPLETLISKPEKMEPGVTMFAINLWRNSTSILDYGYIIAVDSEGEVVWYCNTKDRIADMRLLKNGHLVYQHGSYRFAYEIDILGRDHRRWVANNLTEVPDDESIPVAVDTIHHDLLELQNGNFLTLATELRRFERYPTSEFDPDAPWAPAYVVCDAVIEFQPRTGEIRDELHLIDLLDRQRFGYMALSGFWKSKYDHMIPSRARDWSHANALLHLPQENAIIVSLRHLDCILKIDWTTKKIRWILGNPDGWGEAWQPYLLKPVGDVEWTYHQHSPQITPRGTLMVYDNGNYRARPFVKATLAPENQSRVVEYQIDEEAMTVEQIYEYRGPEGDEFYCPFYCEADWMPQTQNILVTDGGHIELEDGTPNDNVPSERQWARIFEITRTDPPEKVFEMQCDSGIGSEYGWSIYRSIRFPNLYDGFEVLPPAPDETLKLFERKPHTKRIPAEWRR